MRDLQLQTPQRDQTPANRRPKTAPDLNRNPRKGAKKSLNPAFKALPEDDSAVLESLEEFVGASDDNPFSESAENFFAVVHASETQSTEKVVSDLTSTLASTSVTATPYKHVASDTANTRSPEKVDSFQMTKSVEAEVVIKHLREARIQVLKSKDVGPSKKLVEALINVIIEEFHGGLYEENEWLDKLLSRKSNLIFLISIMVMFSLLMVWFSDWSLKESFTGPTPT
ncbi:hypothetical protein C2S53_008325 [Perilla frutescens var. hirtella]|uniref:Uncharacterized protein n=1 Tax=Perilla frutescens var. hirtella TaxID=608512 RepID=A0AAD4JDP3_PERFH|nr:hypothetical protein C2S53_008325 [Perilla frutescens var. hirtella]